MGQPWLDAGHAVWLEEEMWVPRDYLLPLPAEDLQSTRRTKAAYSDAASVSRSLLGALAAEDGTALLFPEAVSYWKVHSERAGLTSWCATLGLGEAEQGFLGR